MKLFSLFLVLLGVTFTLAAPLPMPTGTPSPPRPATPPPPRPVNPPEPVHITIPGHIICQGEDEKCLKTIIKIKKTSPK
ncbi:hypothetical protein M408DRAFT_293901 [Serendipita vermifera MAFF 305830]|uniref:Uncharacterized protein n=1 Tax=Serendipita vermifera MAFF 305830 TaxID=933852 RepID=A0A0C3APN7_SERVB|nr:hypothetical protein M408DRAFT_293901 [Serendipita vermifera MAFF 305830]